MMLGSVAGQSGPLGGGICGVVPVGVNDVDDNVVPILMEEQEIGVQEPVTITPAVGDRQGVLAGGGVSVPTQQALRVQFAQQHLRLPSGRHNRKLALVGTFGNNKQVVL